MHTQFKSLAPGWRWRLFTGLQTGFISHFEQQLTNLQQEKPASWVSNQ